MINIGRVIQAKWTTVSLCIILELPKIDCESTLSISPVCFILGGFQSEEDELDYLSSLLEVDDKTSKDNSQPSVGMYSYVYLYRM